jgi:hypothetical protein
VEDAVAVMETADDTVETADEDAEMTVNDNLYMATFIDYYGADFFGAAIDGFVARHREVMSRLGLLELPAKVKRTKFRPSSSRSTPLSISSPSSSIFTISWSPSRPMNSWN